ncbi:MAG: hypothetical protein HY976_00100 [Candidatus Kerfeldbacteria bacterium]|nr:hypothetical protein [Candidatus Kerfeldbacteria bacterium]
MSGTQPNHITQDEQVRNRRRLINRLMVKLDEADVNLVSNNDIRRLIDDLARILTAARQLERYPSDLPVPDPNDVIKTDHCATDVLRRYADRGDGANISVELLEATKVHIKSCSACRARLRHFQLQPKRHLVCGQPILPHQPQADRLLSENNLTPNFGSAKRDVVHSLSINRGARPAEGIETQLEDEV